MEIMQSCRNGVQQLQTAGTMKGSACADIVSAALASQAPEPDPFAARDDAGRMPSTFRKLLLSSDSPLLLFVTSDSLVIHARRLPNVREEVEGKPSWLQVSYSLPVPHSVVTNAWSAGPHLLVLVGSSLSPFHPGFLSFWSPLSGSMARLPRFASIWHLITLGYGGNMVVAAGFDRNIQCVIEIVHIDQTVSARNIDHTISSSWHIVGHLPLSFNVDEHDEILYCRGAFYVLCMESLMLVIDPLRNKLSLHDIPCPSAPKLINSCDSIFMVEGNHLSDRLQLWKFDSELGQWHANLIDCLYVPKSVSKIVAVKGIGTCIYFILTRSSILVYDVLNCVWHSTTDCSALAIVRPLLWEPNLYLPSQQDSLQAIPY